jgi:hypothetical protein
VVCAPRGRTNSAIRDTPSLVRSRNRLVPLHEIANIIRLGENWGIIHIFVRFAGPLIYVITKRYGTFSLTRSPRHRFPLTISFPYGGLFVSFATGLCLICGFSFAILRAKGSDDSTGALTVNENGIVYFSTVCFLLTSIMLFCVIAYRNLLDEAGRSMPAQEEDFVSEWLMTKK